MPILAMVIAGPTLVGHGLFALGARGAAARILGNDAWRGYELGLAGRYAEAAKAFRSPSDAYDRGDALAMAGSYEEALAAFEQALAVDPSDDDARHNRAVVEAIIEASRGERGSSRGPANADAAIDRPHSGQGDQDAQASSTGLGFVGNKEGSTTSTSQGGSKVARSGANEAPSTSGSDRASGSAGAASGKGRSGGDVADVASQLAANQRRVARNFTARLTRPDVHWLETVDDDPGRFLKLQIRVERKRRREAEAVD